MHKLESYTAYSAKQRGSSGAKAEFDNGQPVQIKLG